MKNIPFHWHILMIWVGLSVVLGLSIYAVTQTITTFSDGTTSKNLTFIPNYNQSFTIDFPRYSYIFNVTINLTGYELQPLCNQSKANKTYTCNGYITSTSNQGNYSSTLSTDFSSYTNFIDDNTSTYATALASSTLFINYQLPLIQPYYGHGNLLNKTIKLSTFNLSSGAMTSFDINTNSLDYDTLNLRILFYNSTDGNRVEYAVKYTSGLTTIGTIYGTNNRLYDIIIGWTFNKPTNLTFYLNNLQTVGILYGQVNSTIRQLSLNSTAINNRIQNCDNTVGDYCRINHTVHSDTAGILNLQIYNITYAYGIDNCSNSFGIPSNATAYDFTWNKVVNLTSDLDYQIYNYHLYQIGVSNLDYCIYPSWFNLSTNVSFQYLDGTAVYNYYLFNTFFDNTTEYINLTIDSGTTMVTATVYDQTNQVMENVYIEVLKKETSGNFSTVGVYKTNFEGDVQIPLILNTQIYKFKLYYPAALLVEETSETPIYSTAINFQIITGEEILSDYFIISKITSSLNFYNASHTFNFTFLDSLESISNGCLKVTSSNYTNTTCISLTGGTITIQVPNTSGSYYIAKGYVTLNGLEYVLRTKDASFPDSAAQSIIGTMGILICVMLVMAFAFILRGNLQLVVILIPLPILMLSAIKFIALDWRIGMSLEIAAVVLAVIIGRDN